MYLISEAILNDIYMDLEGRRHPYVAYSSINSAHGPNEFVTKDDLLEAVEGYKKLILRAVA
jgi:acetylornithine deacetylase/succinyl-diaminopimelate desuccinylase-like protein